jgi:sigma-B regulation protein RsbQ
MSSLTRNHVVVSGRPGAQPVVLSHGYGDDQDAWRLIGPALEEQYQVIRFDHVGAGRSDLGAYDKERYSTLGGYSDDLLEILHELDLKQVIFVGHSVSSMIGLLASVKEPDRFAALVLIAPSARYIDDLDYIGGFTEAQIEQMLDSLDANYLGWSTTIAPVMMGNPDRPELGHELVRKFCHTDPAIASHFARVTFKSDHRAALPQVSVPTLILQCDGDIVAPESAGRYLHQHVPGSRYVRLAAAGHCPHVSAPGETVTAIQAFLRDL